MLIRRLLIIVLFFLAFVLLPQPVFAETTAYRSAGWMATDGNPAYTNLSE